MWRPVLAAVLVVAASVGCAAGPAQVPAAVETRAPPPALDECQRAIGSALHDAPFAATIVLLSKTADAQAATYDAWLRPIASSSSYRWITVDDEASKRFARSAGVADKDASVVIEAGLVRDVVVLDGARGPDAAANIARVSRAVAARAAGGAPAPEGAPCRATSFGPASQAHPEKLSLPESKPLLSKEALARVTAIRIDEPSRSISLTREGERWTVGMPGSPAADAENVGKLLENLGEAEVRETIATGSEQDARFGLDESAATRVRVSAGTETLLELVIGRDGSRGIAVRIGGADVRLAHGLAGYAYRREPRFWRERRIWEIDDRAVQRIEITGARAWVFTKDPRGWRATLAGRPFASLAQQNVEMLIRAFRRPDAEDFAEAGAQTGLDKSTAAVRFLFDGGRRVTLRVGNARPAGGYYAQVEGAPTVFVISTFQASYVVEATPERFGKRP